MDFLSLSKNFLYCCLSEKREKGKIKNFNSFAEIKNVEKFRCFNKNTTDALTEKMKVNNFIPFP